jgi:hypothetical protein
LLFHSSDFCQVYLIYLSTIFLYFHNRPAIPQPHETPHSDTAPVFGLPLRLGHEEEAEWSLREEVRRKKR